MSSSQPRTHKLVTRPSRKRKQVNYLDDDSDLDVGDPPSSHIGRPVRESCRTRPAYRELSMSGHSSDSERSQQSGTIEDEASYRPSHQRVFTQTSRKEEIITNGGRGRPRHAPLRKSLQPCSRKKDRTMANNVRYSQEQSDKNRSSIVPPWQTLEHQILAQIFRESRDQVSPTNSWVHWILDVCLLCKSFHNASMLVLLEKPPLMPSFRAKGLIRLLQSDPNILSVNVRMKVRSLEIDVKSLLLKKSGISIEEFLDLISHTPRLSHLHFIHPHDQIHAIWAQPGAGGRFWAYPDALFDKLDETGILLRVFIWNARFGGSVQVTAKMQTMHSRNCLRTLRSLQILNLNMPQKSTELERSQLANTIVGALQDLPSLEALEFQNCNVADDLLVPQLPILLKDLAFFSCNSLTSSSLQKFLSNSASLHSLRLVSNQAMDLAFFSDLSSTAKDLENLYIDMTYRDVSSFQDVSPHFDQSLPPEAPTWPLTLRSLEITNLRSLSLRELDVFLESVVGASEELSQLQKISIKAIPDGAGTWRDRAKLRSRWQQTFARIYDKPTIDQDTPCPAAQRRMARHAAPKRFEDEDNIHESSPDIPHSNSEALPGSPNIQRRAVLWNLTIDAQRPSDLQYKDEDFMDDELSGDEEWRG